jgi:hypothetical protein
VTRTELLFFCVCGDSFWLFLFPLSIHLKHKSCNALGFSYFSHTEVHFQVSAERACAAFIIRAPLCGATVYAGEEKAHGFALASNKGAKIWSFELLWLYVRGSIGASWNYYTTRGERAGETQCGRVIYWQRSGTATIEAKVMAFQMSVEFWSAPGELSRSWYCDFGEGYSPHTSPKPHTMRVWLHALQIDSSLK